MHRYSVVKSIDGKFGSVDDSGTWNGIVGMLIRKEVDVALTDYYVSQERNEVVDFSYSIMQSV